LGATRGVKPLPLDGREASFTLADDRDASFALAPNQ
jgi:hypothetical protein